MRWEVQNKDVPAFVRVRGNPAGVYGINSIGLRRQGFSKSAIESLNQLIDLSIERI